MPTGLERIAQRAKAEPDCRFTALAHHFTENFLRETWQRLNRKGASGDHVTAAQYAENLDENLQRLVEELTRRHYQAPPFTSTETDSALVMSLLGRKVPFG